MNSRVAVLMSENYNKSKKKPVPKPRPLNASARRKRPALVGKKNAARPNRTTGVVMVNLNSDATPAAMSLVGTSHRGGETLDMVVIAETAGTATAGTATAGTANGTAEAVRGLSRLGVRTADTILGIPETVVATRATNAATTEARPVMIQGEAAGVGDPAGKSKERQEQVMYA